MSSPLSSTPIIPGAMIDEIGLHFEANSPAKNRDFGVLHLQYFRVSGKADYLIDVGKQTKEFASITPFSHNHGSWELVDKRWMEAMTLDHAEAMTGNYFAKDVSLHSTLVVHSGRSALLSLRVQGAQRGYYGGFHEGKLGIFKHTGDKMIALAAVEQLPTLETEYEIAFSVTGTTMHLEVSGFDPLDAADESLAYGMVGFALYERGRVGFGNLQIKEN